MPTTVRFDCSSTISLILYSPNLSNFVCMTSELATPACKSWLGCTAENFISRSPLTVRSDSSKHVNNDDVTIWQYAITMALRRAKWTHEISTKMSASRGLRSFFLHAKDFAFAHEVAAKAWKIQPVVIRWIKMASRMARCFHDQTQIWTFSYSRVHLLSNSSVVSDIFRLTKTIRRKQEAARLSYEGNTTK